MNVEWITKTLPCGTFFVFLLECNDNWLFNLEQKTFYPSVKRLKAMVNSHHWPWNNHQHYLRWLKFIVTKKKTTTTTTTNTQHIFGQYAMDMSFFSLKKSQKLLVTVKKNWRVWVCVCDMMQFMTIFKFKKERMLFDILWPLKKIFYCPLPKKKNGQQNNMETDTKCYAVFLFILKVVVVVSFQTPVTVKKTPKRTVAFLCWKILFEWSQTNKNKKK